jgi:hypothetical protein
MKATNISPKPITSIVGQIDGLNSPIRFPIMKTTALIKLKAPAADEADGFSVTSRTDIQTEPITRNARPSIRKPITITGKFGVGTGKLMVCSVGTKSIRAVMLYPAIKFPVTMSRALEAVPVIEDEPRQAPSSSADFVCTVETNTNQYTGHYEKYG